MLNPISTITVDSALVPATSEPETATPDLFQTLIADLLETIQPPDTPPVSQPVAQDLEQIDASQTRPAHEPQQPQGPQAQQEPQIPLLGKGGVDATSKKYREAFFERSGRDGWFKQPLNDNPCIELTAVSAPTPAAGRLVDWAADDNRWLETTTPSAPQRNGAIFFMAQLPLLREGGEYASSQRDVAEPISEDLTNRPMPAPMFVTFMPPFSELMVNHAPAVSDIPVDIQPAQILSRAQIVLPAMELTSIKIEREALTAPVTKATVPPEFPRLPRTLEFVPTPIADAQINVPKPDVQTPQTAQPAQTPVQPEVTKAHQLVQPQPIVLAPESSFTVPAAIGGSLHFAQSGSQEKQDFHNENGRAPSPETVSITPHLENPVGFQSHLMHMESPAPVAHVVEPPPQLPLPIAHRVSIDIGEKDSRVVVTLHENRGDISVKIHAPNEVLGAELRTSAGTLIEAFHREQIPLTNMDFTSGYTATSDDRQQHGSRPRQSFQNRAGKFASAPTDQVEITSINLNA